jgi:hypothetical protein
MARRRQAVTGKSNAGGACKKAKKLSKEAFKLVDDKAHEIAQTLLGKTLKGNVESARLLVELAEGNVEAEETVTMRPFRSQALSLAAEPVWQGELPGDETDFDSPEPQG